MELNIFVIINCIIIATVLRLVRTNEITGTEDGNEKLPNGAYKVYRVYPNNTEQLQFLQTLWKSASKMQLNFWKDPSRVGVASDIMVPPEVQQSLENLLSSNNVDFFVTIHDVRKLIIERERHQVNDWHKDILADDLMTKFRNTPSFDFRRYHSYEEMRVFMRSLERQNPSIAKVYTLGFSHENRPIEMIKISDPINANSKKAIWIDAGIHAREWASHSTALYFMHQLVTKYEKDPQITQFVRNLTWYITPAVNPDGYEFTRSSREPEVRMWRKNRSPNTEKCANTGHCCMGVDLNRNFDFHWSETGASDNPCEEIYQGAYAFSEPEARAVRNFILSHKNEIEAVITMHTYSQLWIHPFGHQRAIYPPDVDDLKDTADKATKALEKMYGTKYRVGSGADTLYPASGGSDDWAKSRAGVKYVYLLELRPEEDVFDGFVLDTNQLIPTARETWEGVKVVTSTILQKNGYQLVSRSRKRNSGRPRIRTAFRGRHRNRHQHGLKFIEKNREKYFGERFRQRDFTPAPTTTTTTITTTVETSSISTSGFDGTVDPVVSSSSSSSSDIVVSSSSSPTTSSVEALSTTVAISSTIEGNLPPAVDDLFQLSSTTSTVSSSSLVTWYPVADQPGLVSSCSDFAGEDRCRRWATHRVGICQRIPDYMNRNCALTCGFCTTL